MCWWLVINLVVELVVEDYFWSTVLLTKTNVTCFVVVYNYCLYGFSKMYTGRFQGGACASEVGFMVYGANTFPN